jgi:hypothetical protein
MVMSATVSKEPDDCIVIRISAVLSYEDLKSLQKAAKEILRPDERVNVLVLAENFSGWGKSGDWGDLTFLYETDPLINKIAVVANEKWEEEILMFLGAGRRQAEVQCFFPEQQLEARAWLAEPADAGDSPQSNRSEGG